MVMEIAQILLIVAVLAYVIGRRMVGQPYTPGRALTVPAIMVGYGLFELTKVHVGPVAVAVLAVETMIGVAFGVVRGLTIRLFERDGYLWYRYTPWTIVLWIVTVAARLGMMIGVRAMGTDLPTATLVAALGVSLLGEAAVVLPRARRTGVPMAGNRRVARASAGVR
jgi:hypothetical protein